MRIEGISAHQLPHSQKSLIHPRFVRVPGQSSNVVLQHHQSMMSRVGGAKSAQKVAVRSHLNHLAAGGQGASAHYGGAPQNNKDLSLNYETT